MTQQLSPAVQVLIQRLSTDPDDFFGPVGRDDRKGRPLGEWPRFSDMRISIERHILGVKSADDSSADTLWFLTPEERTALGDAFREARRIRFEADTMYGLMTPRESDVLKYNTKDRYSNQGVFPTTASTQLLTSANMAEQALKVMESSMQEHWQGYNHIIKEPRK